jgi:molybdate transport system regulatory protein
MEKLERAFRAWAAGASSGRRRASRSRILLIFLIIRYTGAKLSEVLALDHAADINTARCVISFRGAGADAREVQISGHLAREMESLLRVAEGAPGGAFAVDPSHVRRRFYETARECSLAKEQGGPEMLRKARAVELMRNNMPLPAVQRLLGHSTPNLTSSRVFFSDEDMRDVTRGYMERESGRKTSARNTFFGTVRSLAEDSVQTLAELACTDGGVVSALVTNTSARRLGLRVGAPVAAEVKAPWLILERKDRPGRSSAENEREGVVIRITAGGVNTECAVRVPNGAELCAVLSTPAFRRLELREGDPVRVLFSSCAVILHTE